MRPTSLSALILCVFVANFAQPAFAGQAAAQVRDLRPRTPPAEPIKARPPVEDLRGRT